VSFADRLLQEVAIMRSTPGAVDEYNMPALSWSTLASVRALIQPKRGLERAQLNEAGAVLGDYRVFMLPTDVTEGDNLVCQDPAGVWQIEFVADAGGVGHHLEIDATRLTP
jgi:hypothetical protein